MTIKIYSINKDDWDCGHDFAICDECGAHIRHIIEINGMPFGRDCGAVKLGWTEKGKRLNKKVDRIAYLTESLRQAEQISKNTQWAESTTFELVQALGIPDPYIRPNCTGWEYTNKVLGVMD